MYIYLLEYSWNIAARSTKKLLASKEENWLAGTSEWERLG